MLYIRQEEELALFLRGRRGSRRGKKEAVRMVEGYNSSLELLTLL